MTTDIELARAVVNRRQSHGPLQVQKRVKDGLARIIHEDEDGVETTFADYVNHADANFVAWVNTAIGPLLDELERTRKQRDLYRAACDVLDDVITDNQKLEAVVSAAYLALDGVLDDPDNPTPEIERAHKAMEQAEGMEP